MHSNARVQILCRSRQGVITEAWSDDGGETWSRMTATSLPNPSAGIDALRLRDGRFLLVYNPSAQGRDKLEIAVSPDGKKWRQAVVLENAPASTPIPP
jgi:predicted neuraminidase